MALQQTITLILTFDNLTLTMYFQLFVITMPFKVEELTSLTM